MRSIFSILFLSLSISFLAQDLETKTRWLADSPQVKNGRFSFYAKNLRTQEVLISQDIDRKMSPASTLKLLTTYAIMDILGPDHRFTTKVGHTGIINPDGILLGDIIIEAGGDPSLGAESFKDEYGNGSPIAVQTAVAMRQSGIKEVQGKIIFDETIYEGIDVPDEWTWQDMGNYYGAGAHAFTYKDNMFKAYFKSGSQAGEETELVELDTELEDMIIENQVVSASIRSDQAFFYSSPHSSIIRMFGRIPLNKKNFEVKGALTNPKESFRKDLLKAMKNTGITKSDKEYFNADQRLAEKDVQEFTRFESPRLEELVARTNLKSVNLYAEHFLRHIGKKRNGIGSFHEGIKALKNWIEEKGLSSASLTITDGSGLSRADLVSTRFMVLLLSSLINESYYEAFKRGLPVAGRTGSMRGIGKGSAVEGKMFAKTGYIEGARGYCGFVEQGGETIAFSILANDYDLSASQMRVKMNELLIELGK